MRASRGSWAGASATTPRAARSALRAVPRTIRLAPMPNSVAWPSSCAPVLGRSGFDSTSPDGAISSGSSPRPSRHRIHPPTAGHVTSDAREPTTISNNSTKAREQTEAREEMPLKRPVLTEANHAGLEDPAPEITPMAVFIVGALMVLLCAGAIFKLARRKTHLYRRGRRVVSSRPRRLHPAQKMRVNMSETTAHEMSTGKKKAVRST